MVDDTIRQTSRIDSVTRRRLLRLAGAGATLGVAGAGRASGQELADESYTATARLVPSEMQFNHYNPQQFPIRSRLYIWDNLGNINLQTGGVDPFGAEEISYGDGTITFSLDDRTWHNGDPYVAEDLPLKFKLDRFVGENEWRQITGFNVVDDKTVEFELLENVNTDVLNYVLFTGNGSKLWTPTSIYGDYVSRIEEAISYEEALDTEFDNYPQQAKDVINELVQFAPEEPVGNGLWRHDSATETTHFLVKHEDHPAADDINFSQTDLIFATGSARVQNFRADTYDIYNPQEVAVLAEGPDHFEFYSYLMSGGLGWNAQLDPEASAVANRHVRRAILYLIPYEQLTEAMGGSFQPPTSTIMTGFSWTGTTPDPLTDEHVSRIQEEFDDFGVESRPEEAAAELQAAGWSNQGGTWVDQDGNPGEIPFGSPTGGARLRMTQPLASFLEGQGFTVPVDVSDQHFTDQQSGNFRGLDAYSYGDRLGYHPFSDFRINWFVLGPYGGLGETLTAPETVGDPDSSETEWNIVEMTNQLQQNLPEEEYSQIILELGWVFNQNPTVLQSSEQLRPYFLDTRDWEWDMEVVRRYMKPPHMVPKKGGVQARTG